MQVDLKPEELYTYEGSSPCPEDIDRFWDDAVREMEALDPEVTLTPVLPYLKNTEAFDLYFTGVGGARVYAKYLRPKNAKNAPVVFLFHGYTDASPDWVEIMGYVAEGFCVAALDCRGQGGKSEDNGRVRGNTQYGHLVRGLIEDSPKKLLFYSLFLDTAELVRIVEKFPETDATRLYATGGSQGGGLTLACAALSPQIKKAAPRFPFLCDYKRVWLMDLDVRAYAELKDYFRHFDPRHEKEDEAFLRLGYIDVQNIAKRIRAKVLMFTGLMDSTCPPSTQFAAFNKIKSEKKVVFYPDFAHEYMPEAEDMIFRFFIED